MFVILPHPHPRNHPRSSRLRSSHRSSSHSKLACKYVYSSYIYFCHRIICRDIIYCKRAILSLSSSKILTPHPPLRPASVYPPPLLRGRTHLPGGEGDGGSIFWKTRENQDCPLTVNNLSTALQLRKKRRQLRQCCHLREFTVNQLFKVQKVSKFLHSRILLVEVKMSFSQQSSVLFGQNCRFGPTFGKSTCYALLTASAVNFQGLFKRIRAFNLRLLKSFTYVQCLYRSDQIGLHTKRLTLVFFLAPTKPLKSCGYRQARTGDTFLVNSRQITSMSQTLPWWLGVRRGKDDRKQNTLAPLDMFSKADVCRPSKKHTTLFLFLALKVHVNNK